MLMRWLLIDEVFEAKRKRQKLGSGDFILDILLKVAALTLHFAKAQRREGKG